MKVDYLFSRRDKCGSKAIAWASRYEQLDLDQIPSHVAVLINETIVIESTFTTGVRMLPYSKWFELNEELYRIPCSQKYRPSKETLDLAFSLWDKGYDWKGIAYFGWSFIKLIVFKTPLPKTNQWERRNKYFCTEFVAMLVGEDFSMSTPAKICDTWLKEAESGREN